jgi:hypothetical protein
MDMFKKTIASVGLAVAVSGGVLLLAGSPASAQTTPAFAQTNAAYVQATGLSAERDWSDHWGGHRSDHWDHQWGEYRWGEYRHHHHFHHGWNWNRYTND